MSIRDLIARFENPQTIILPTAQEGNVVKGEVSLTNIHTNLYKHRHTRKQTHKETPKHTHNRH